MVNTIHVNQINEIMNGEMHLTTGIESGMCGTEFCGSDRYRVVVVDVITPKKILVSMLHDCDAEQIFTDDNGIHRLPMERVEKYRNIKPTYFGHPTVYTLRKNNRWMPKGYGMWETSSVMIGHAEEYRDPCF